MDTMGSDQINNWFKYLNDGEGKIERLIVYLTSFYLIIMGIFVSQLFVIMDEYIITSSGNIDLSFWNSIRLFFVLTILMVGSIVFVSIFKFLCKNRVKLIQLIENILRRVKGYQTSEEIYKKVMIIRSNLHRPWIITTFAPWMDILTLKSKK